MTRAIYVALAAPLIAAGTRAAKADMPGADRLDVAAAPSWYASGIEAYSAESRTDPLTLSATLSKQTRPAIDRNVAAYADTDAGSGADAGDAGATVSAMVSGITGSYIPSTGLAGEHLDRVGDAKSGQSISISTPSLHLGDVTLEAVATPLPGGVALAGIGLALAAAIARRTRRS